jgi:general secretion pathway protein G
MNQAKRRKKGFTLIELLVVILIITMLATLLAPRIFKGLGKAKQGIARGQMAIIDDALGRFYLDCGRLPDQSEGLEALLTAPAALTEKWDGPYLKTKDLIDPWEHPFAYRAQGTINEGSYDLISFGADGSPGGEGENEDIYND